MIFIKLHSGMGNQMFQYGFGKILEGKTNQRVYFYVENLNEFKLKYFQNINYFILPKFLLWPYRLIKKRKFRYFEFLSCLHEVKVEDVPNFSIVEGYFQSADLISKFKDQVNYLFRIKEEYVQEYFNFVKKDLQFFPKSVVHVRLGDYRNTVFHEVGAKGIIPSNWFNQIIANNDYSDFFFVSDEPNGLDGFFKYRLNQAQSNSEIVDFQILMNAHNLIISNSSFSWWGAFLNKKEEKKVYAPYNWVGYNAGIEYPKGIMIDDFIWVK